MEVGNELEVTSARRALASAEGRAALGGLAQHRCPVGGEEGVARPIDGVLGDPIPARRRKNRRKDTQLIKYTKKTLMGGIFERLVHVNAWRLTMG